MENLSKKQILIIGGILVIIIIVVGYYFLNNIKNINYDYLDDTNEVELSDENRTELKEDKEKIIVHIAGAVNKEGIVTLDEDSRIINAINEAGGLKQDANLTDVNLAYVLSDGQKIYIPYLNDEKESLVSSENGDNIIKDSAQQVSANNSKVNINTANLEKLLELPGVGSSTAQKIINYRSENGKFNVIEDLKNVSGIGESKYNSIKDYICVK